jgi:hypothetical protein
MDVGEAVWNDNKIRALVELIELGTKLFEEIEAPEGGDEPAAFGIGLIYEEAVADEVPEL